MSIFVVYIISPENVIVHKHYFVIFQDIELDEESEGDENVDPKEENVPEAIVKDETVDEKGEKDINKEYDMDNYDDGEKF